MSANLIQRRGLTEQAPRTRTAFRFSVFGHSLSGLRITLRNALATNVEISAAEVVNQKLQDETRHAQAVHEWVQSWVATHPPPF